MDSLQKKSPKFVTIIFHCCVSFPSLSEWIVLTSSEGVGRGLAGTSIAVVLLDKVLLLLISSNYVRIGSVGVTIAGLLKVVVHLHLLLTGVGLGPVLELPARKESVKDDSEEVDAGGDAEDCLPLEDELVSIFMIPGNLFRCNWTNHS